ncbi:MAG: metallophosphoesterase [Victivallales bacterium]|nr:metallophosphoesterase [Victivallales bacterium]
MKARIVILTDLHFSRRPDGFTPARKNELADVLLLRAVHRINRYLKPDLVFIGGDLLNDSASADRLELLAEIKEITALIETPVITIPGNHDPEAAEFYRVIDSPPEYLDINGIRFVPFVDPAEPGYNASRPAVELERMRKLGMGFPGPVVSLQHVPLFPPEAACCDYNYLNADEIVRAMRETGYVLALSGHYHRGFELLGRQGMNFIAGRILCEKPFGYSVIEIDTGGKVSSIQENLAMPENLNLVDYHVHTRLAYCNENMDMNKSIMLGQMFGLSGLVISEHSAHLYFNRTDYRRRAGFYEGLDSAKREDRTGEYFALYAREAGDFCRLGMEIDFDCRGKALIEPEVLSKLEFRNGAVHCLRGVMENADIGEIEREFIFLTEAALASGVDVLVHPFRIFRRSGLETPRHLFAPVAGLLKRYGTAVEINYHSNDPDPEFFRMCIENGVKISLGSDAHNLYEVGEFYASLRFLREIAPDFDLADLLIR